MPLSALSLFVDEDLDSGNLRRAEAEGLDFDGLAGGEAHVGEEGFWGGEGVGLDVVHADAVGEELAEVFVLGDEYDVEAAGFEVLVFHSTGAGGRAMESLIESGLVAGVLDITTTEWADELVGGILGAGPARLDAAAKAGVPAIVVPGCLDMVNFGEPQTVPAKFAGRTFYHHNPQVTLMRTNAAECAELGRILAEKVNRYPAPVTVLLPLRAISVISAEGQPFYDPAADAALFGAIKQHLRPEIPVIELDAKINDPAFAQACAGTLLATLVGAAR